MGRLDAVDASYDEFYSYYKSLNGKDETLIPELERKLRSYILEFRIYLAHWEKYIAHHPRAKEYQQLFKQLTNDAYANNDEYAMAYMLRNYVTHANDLIQGRFWSEDGKHFSIHCVKNVLLKDSLLNQKKGKSLNGNRHK